MKTNVSNVTKSGNLGIFESRFSRGIVFTITDPFTAFFCILNIQAL